MRAPWVKSSHSVTLSVSWKYSQISDEMPTHTAPVKVAVRMLLTSGREHGLMYMLSAKTLLVP